MCRSNTQRHTTGFTLLELLVSISIFAIMSVMAYGGINQIITNNSSAETALDRIQAAQQAIHTLSRDFSQIVPRKIRDELGDEQDYLIAGSNPDYSIEFSRGGRRNPAALARSSLQRVAYQLDNDILYRLLWPQMDRVQGMEPYRSELISGVDRFSLRYLDHAAQWHEQWPPATLAAVATPAAGTGNGVATAPTSLPLAIEVTLTLNDWGELKRLYLVNK